MIEMTVEGIGIDPSNNPLVLLRDAERKIFVPIWIGPAEAVSIQMELDDKQPQRPMTHDLLTTILRELGATLVRVTVNEFSGDVYYASLHVQVGRNSENLQEIDARPSDAIALALRAHAQILVAEEVAERTGIQVEEQTPLAVAEGNAELLSPADEVEIDKLSRLLEDVDLDN